VAARCPICDEPRGDADRFCGSCRYDFRGVSGGWQATVTADRSRFDRVAPDGVEFPEAHEAWVLAFSSDPFTLGRRTLPGDPGISRDHADIIRTPVGLSIVDRGSLNGTTVNEDTAPLTPNVPRPLKDGDSVHLGAWTMLTIRLVRTEDDDDDD
jgi:hypothetical protein